MNKKLSKLALIISVLVCNIGYVNAVTVVSCGNVTDIPKKIWK